MSSTASSIGKALVFIGSLIILGTVFIVSNLLEALGGGSISVSPAAVIPMITSILILALAVRTEMGGDNPGMIRGFGVVFLLLALPSILFSPLGSILAAIGGVVMIAGTVTGRPGKPKEILPDTGEPVLDINLDDTGFYFDPAVKWEVAEFRGDRDDGYLKANSGSGAKNTQIRLTWRKKGNEPRKLYELGNNNYNRHGYPMTDEDGMLINGHRAESKLFDMTKERSGIRIRLAARNSLITCDNTGRTIHMLFVSAVPSDDNPRELLNRMMGSFSCHFRKYQEDQEASL